MFKSRLPVSFAMVLLWSLYVPMSASAQSYDLSWFVLDGGGSTQPATSTSYRIKDSIGQSVVGECASASYTAGIGFGHVYGLVVPSFITVTNTSDSGSGSLRQAILDANSNTGFDVIYFDIPGSGPHTIQPSSSFPDITDPVIIDGTSQPGYGGSPIIELDGSNAGSTSSGLVITAGNSTIKGLAVNRFADAGISMSVNGNNRVEDNYLGTDIAGTTARGNSSAGVQIMDVADNVVLRNVISGNILNGIWVEHSNAKRNKILGNYIGLAANGTALGNGDFGVKIREASENEIGGTSADFRNVISANGWHGILIEQCGAGSNNMVQGNYVGTDTSGSNARGNIGTGIVILNSEDVLIGGTEPGARNIISGNQGNGISIWEPDSKNNIVQGNIIGLDATGTLELGNRRGINIGYASGNIIGGSNQATRNIISGNRLSGLLVVHNSATGNQIRGNYIGTDIAGENAISNGHDPSMYLGEGIMIYNAPNNQIGGVHPGNGNLISGNKGFGIRLIGKETYGTNILGNKIGTTADGTESLPNTSDGVRIDWDEEDVQVGGANNTVIYSNKIAFNNGAGVSVVHGNNNKISQNQIYLNDGLGIDLGIEGVTANDENDVDSGPNRLQNYPLLTNAIFSTNVIVKGSLNSLPSTIYGLEFFKNTQYDPSYYGEGEVFVLETSLTTNASGYADFEVELPGVQAWEIITATATDPENNTSEFSRGSTARVQLAVISEIVPPLSTTPVRTYIPAYMSYASFNTSWPGSDVKMTLITPSGRVITRTTSEDDVEHENGPTFEYYTVTDPEPGNWTIELFGADVPDDGEEVSLTVTGVPTEPITLPKTVKQSANDALAALLSTGDKKTDHEIEKAIEHIQKSLAEELWETDETLTLKGKKVFDEEKKAVHELMKIEDPPMAIADAIHSLVRADELLAQTAIHEALDAGGDAKEIPKARKEINKAAEEIGKGHYTKAIDHYKKAWEHARKAMKKVPEPDEDLCAGHGTPHLFTMEYTGEGEDALDHSQDPKKVSVVGDPGYTSPVHIIATDKEDPNHPKAKVWFDGIVDLDAEFAIDAMKAGEKKLKAVTYVSIFDRDDHLLQTVEFHTSCSQPLSEGDQFGSLVLGGFVESAAKPVAVPERFSLLQNRPNPFNPVTTIGYTLPEAGDVRLTIYTVTGQRVGILVSAHQAAGRYEVVWDGNRFANGVYFYRLEAGAFVQTQRMLLLK